MQDVNKWLTKLHADGVSLSIQQLLYYQAKTSLLNLAPSKTIQSKLAGSYLAKTKGRGMEFDEARHYQPGDDIRAIDWRVTARTGKTHTKLYREEKERPIFVLADMSASMHFGTQLFIKSVQVAHLASLIAWAASDRGDRIGGLIFNQHKHLELKPFTRKKAVLGLLHGLIDMHTPEDLSPGPLALSDACARLRRLVHPGSLIFVLSDFQQLDEATKQHLSRISKHSEVIAYSISDPFEHELPDLSSIQRLEVTDGVGQQSLVLGEKNVAKAYKANHQQHFQSLTHTLRQCKVQTLPISAASALETQMGRFNKEVE